ncbi:hypothetical protein JQU17_05985 [Ponticoccus sp. SC2-23]|uniref:hypothetical protein n=1 Tax=Alexandriicola marinus TaxID=2081710 RepID=UPI000FDBA2C7|nr:hypothetical protein [Alexandriicola marinus]MBM1219739.1 hypothetical protein [Ponticoccus sp. SC6-9]MBM1223189.1 hypothetical protein [Ponticoccus sp. SC6-15]MBM1229552.1 hypothetical protein [Ponticoccus sp. SC6-38]MBM1232155.1 hypothetical protein [Ponticoccus sp. SC6-45]MBM1237895.1 hypothetical protein [Ponticoccus sp. SC6-49]MBM1241166.1 hypothetical protein [Ponticoccus sp. SC2-64]MBM1245679.1 hypothetical protein [Ponticoccus sp. SC6-42]MBM1250157.1 hypothetical protein [Pontico
MPSHALVAAQLAQTEADGNGCQVTPTVGPRKVRFRGMQDRLYRFVDCIRHRDPPGGAFFGTPRDHWETRVVITERGGRRWLGW